MSLMDTLRKLGIVRFGTKAATYRNATERPTEFLMDDIGNAEKEVINLDALGKSAPTKPQSLPPVIAGAPTATPCWKCGATLPPGAKFCGGCGTPQPARQAASDACAKCGAALKPSAKFCGSCGAPVAGAPSPTVMTGAPPKSSSKLKGCLIGGLIGFALLVVLLVVLAIIGSQTDSPKQAATNEPAAATTPPAAPAAKETPAPAPAPTQAPASSANDSFKPAVPVAPPAQEAYKPASPAMPPPPPATPSADYVPGTASPPAAAGAVKYDRYANPKFGFVTELPAHWESEVRNNTHLFSGPKGSEDYNVTVNFQFIAMTAPGQVAQQKQSAVEQWQKLEGFRLIEDNIYKLQDQYPAGFLHACYKMPGNDTLWEQIQVIIERQPYYYFIGYTSPQPLFEKYYPHLKHLIQTLRFTPLPQ